MVPAPQLRHGAATLRISELHGTGTEDHRDANQWSVGAGDCQRGRGEEPQDHPLLPLADLQEGGNQQSGVADTLGNRECVGRSGVARYGGERSGTGAEKAQASDSAGQDSAGADALNRWVFGMLLAGR